jgi:hypothetical protein
MSSFEIDRLHYCAAGAFLNNEAYNYACAIGQRIDPVKNGCCVPECGCYHRKWETPVQYKQRTGKDWPDDAAVYYLMEAYEIVPGESKVHLFRWFASEYGHFKNSKLPLVCACALFGKPSDDWRPDDAAADVPERGQ